MTSEDDPESSEEVDTEMIDAELEKLMKGLEHGSSSNTTRGRAGRRGEMDEVSGVLVLFTANEYSVSV